MSNIYIQEPPTNGKVVLYTTVGEIEIELWCKETPLACRNFIQLCIEGYYNNTVFHRLVPGFIIQGGDPSGTGFGGESALGEPFKDEFHSRLRFIRRGLVATANNGEKNANGSQFFFTLDATPELQNKHTIFGKVVGDTLFNMLKLGDSEVDTNERPIFLNKILRTEVLRNPFDDITPRILQHADKDETLVVSKSKATKNFGLLSFGDEAEEEEEEVAAVVTEFRTKPKSSHDLATDPLLSSESVLIAPAEVAVDLASNEKVSKIQQKLQEASLARKIEEPTVVTSDPKVSKAEELRRQALVLQMELTKPRESAASANVPVLKSQLPNDPAVKDYQSQMDIYESRRRKKGVNREEKTLDRLKNFKSTLESVRGIGLPDVDSATNNSASKATTDEDNDSGWMKHALSFEVEARLARDANLKKEADWYELVDPRNPINKRKSQGVHDGKKKSKT